MSSSSFGNSTGSTNSTPVTSSAGPTPKMCGNVVPTPAPPASTHSESESLKRSSSIPLHHSTPSTSHGLPPSKKHKLSSSFRDISLADAAKHGTLTDFAYFDKVCCLETSGNLNKHKSTLMQYDCLMKSICVIKFSAVHLTLIGLGQNANI